MSNHGNARCASACVFALVGILLMACVLRSAAVALRSENLRIDRDSYLAIAQNLVNGNGFCSVPGQPTAFRPPLYPLLVAGCLCLGGVSIVGVVQIVLGTGTVWLTWLLARQCRLSQQTGLIAAALVAVDPLLIEYSTQAMTETLFTFLVALLLVLALRTGHTDRKNQNSVLLGTVFGLTALCRPTIWAFGGLAALGWGFQQIQHRLKNRRSLEPDRLTPFFRAGLCVVATVLVVLPWVLRNARQFNHPIVMTTHGGYTLLLGNNETFFQQVVAGKSGATWTEASLETWKAENKRKLASMGIAPSDEVSEDAAQVKLAKTWIIANPTKFLRACRLRIRRFWACRPSVAPGVPPMLVQLVGYYYSSVFVLAIVGALRWWKLWLKYWPLPAFVLALTIVHSVYWSNARMRSAAVPVITLAAAAAFQRTFHSAGADQAFLQE